eukprot:13901818-Alexandrium_andersonii.AAC.1
MEPRLEFKPLPAIRQASQAVCDAIVPLPDIEHEGTLAALDATVLKETILRFLVHSATVAHGASLRFGSPGLTGVHQVTLDCLTAQGVVVARPSEFGEVSYPLDATRVAWAPSPHFSNPALDVLSDRSIASVALLTKVELLLALHEAGWRYVRRAPLTYTRGGEMVLSRASALKGSKWYLIACLCADAIFDKGSLSIAHARPE